MILRLQNRNRRRAASSVFGVWRRAALGAVAGSVLLVLLMPVYATQTESGRDTCFLGHPEGTQAGVDGWSWWPIGTRCSLLLRDGERLVQTVPPWRGTADWSRVPANEP